MDLKLWHTILTDAVHWQDIDEHMAIDIYRRTVVAWGHDMTYHMNGGPESIDLTKLYEQYKMVAALKRTNFDQEKDNHGHI